MPMKVTDTGMPTDVQPRQLRDKNTMDYSYCLELCAQESCSVKIGSSYIFSCVQAVMRIQSQGI